MKKNNIILVTGGSGLIGTYLKNELPEAIYVSSRDYDLTNQIEVESMFIKYKPDVLIVEVDSIIFESQLLIFREIKKHLKTSALIMIKKTDDKQCNEIIRPQFYFF